MADKVIRDGDALFGSVVTGLGLSRGLNDNGDIAFFYTLNNGVSGIAVTVVPGPVFLAGDFNEVGEVDGEDLTRWQDNFGTGTTHMQGNADGDGDGDGDVDGADFLVWQRQLGGSAIVASATAVPEPTTAILLLLGYATAGILTSRGGLHWKPFAKS